MVARPIFVGGTASHAGKSWMATAICRFLRQRGARVAPFKAQNMSLNSYPCRNGGEIGRAQAVQAEACGLEPVTDMNPILLKPNSAAGSQVIVDGKVWRNLSAREYYEHFDSLLERVLAAYERLSQSFEYIVIEGAGSVTEMNLKRTDLVNFGLATRIGAPVLLVADIDRGGVFASLVGSRCLLEPEERTLVRSFAINRFRGDPALFASGVETLQNKTEWPCLGVFPFLDVVRIDEEDSVSLDDLRPTDHGHPRVAILRFPRVSNFTDFRLLPGARWINEPAGETFDCVILPGSKNTIADLQWLRSRGLDQWIVQQHEQGARIIGICGGYQMLGRRIADPHCVESDSGAAEGLGLLEVDTVLEVEKTTRAVDAVTPTGLAFQAYEIHMGRTARPTGCEPFARTSEGEDGIRAGRCTGTYLHGALENAAVLSELLGASIAEAPSKESAYARLADWFEQHADMRLFEEAYL